MFDNNKYKYIKGEKVKGKRESISKLQYSPAVASSVRSSGSPPHCGCSGWAEPGSAAPALDLGRSVEEKQDSGHKNWVLRFLLGKSSDIEVPLKPQRGGFTLCLYGPKTQ